MNTKNLILIGGAVVLVGLYLTDKKTKDKAKADADAKVLAEALAKAKLQVNSNTNTIKKNSQEILTPEEATVYATKTIAEVNSLLLKYPLVKNEKFTSKINFESGFSAIKTIQIAKQQELNEQIRAEKDYNTYSDVRNTWKMQFSTVYKDLKNYFSTLSKEKADSIIKFLPKLTLMLFVDDQDPRIKDLFSQQEMIDVIDSNIDTESLTEKALPEYSMLIRRMWSANKNLMMTELDYNQTTPFGSVTPQECAKRGKIYREQQVYCIKAPCPSGFGVCE